MSSVVVVHSTLCHGLAPWCITLAANRIPIFEKDATRSYRGYSRSWLVYFQPSPVLDNIREIPRVKPVALISKRITANWGTPSALVQVM
jgi:hypothetical protein